MPKERLIFIEFICECGQCEMVRLEATSYSVCFDGPVRRDWEERSCPYPYDPRCVACGRHKRPAIQAFSGRRSGANPPDGAIQS